MRSVSNIIFATMTSGHEGYRSPVHDLETARSMFDAFAAAGYRDAGTAGRLRKRVARADAGRSGRREGLLGRDEVHAPVDPARGMNQTS